MKLTFVHEYAVEETMIFDLQYEPELQLELEEKRELLRASITVWLLRDGELAGEIYGLSPFRYASEYGETIEDTADDDATVLYVVSTTILPPFEGRGLAKVVKAYFQGFVRASGYRAIVGHATSPAMVHVNADFGAVFGAVRERWYGTQRAAHFSRIDL